MGQHLHDDATTSIFLDRRYRIPQSDSASSRRVSIALSLRNEYLSEVIFREGSFSRQLHVDRPVWLAIPQPAVSAITLSENAVLARMSPAQRWSYIAKHHPIEFWASIAAIVCAVYVLVSGLFAMFPRLY